VWIEEQDYFLTIMLNDIAESVLEFVFRLFVEIICFYTGEIILFILTLGRRTPRWDYYEGERPAKGIVLSEISIWIGFLFWIFLIGWFVRTFVING
jgi:hypothetical protein